MISSSVGTATPHLNDISVTVLVSATTFLLGRAWLSRTAKLVNRQAGKTIIQKLERATGCWTAGWPCPGLTAMVSTQAGNSPSSNAKAVLIGICAGVSLQ